MSIPVFVRQYTNALDNELIETHAFPDSDAFAAWVESQDTTLYIEVELGDESL